MESLFITVEKLNNYRDSLYVGQEVRVPKTESGENSRSVVRIKKAEIIDIYPNVVRTTLGDFKYIDLYLAR